MLFKLFYNSAKKLRNYLFFCLIIFSGLIIVKAQDLELKVKILPASRVRIEGKFLNQQAGIASRELSFLQNYADISGLGARIENPELFDQTGEKINLKKLAEGEFEAEKIPAVFAYNVKIVMPENPVSAAHVSSMMENQALLMMEDLLPQFRNSRRVFAKIAFELPVDWKITSSEIKTAENVFSTENVEKSVFLLGRNWREKAKQLNKTEVILGISGEWQFSDDEAMEMAAAILSEHRKIFGDIPLKKVQIYLLPLSGSLNPDRWRAETRGSTVTIMSGAIASKREALQRLHEQLRHELFHLWIPNAVSLIGNYDWFYEGFTIYQALRTGVQTNQIRFEDYLNTLGQAFNLSKNQNVSPIEMSNKRWSGAPGPVYAKGMVIAFLCDLAILRQSSGKHSITEIFQKIYKKYHAGNTAADGNTAIIEILNGYPELSATVKNYIQGSAKMEVKNELNDFGLNIFEEDRTIKLKVMPELTGRQKDLLDNLGYNNWRKLLQTKR